MEERIQLYLTTFKNVDRAMVIKMITSFDAHIEKRRIFCHERLSEIEAKEVEEKRKVKEEAERKVKRK